MRIILLYLYYQKWFKSKDLLIRKYQYEQFQNLTCFHIFYSCQILESIDPFTKTFFETGSDYLSSGNEKCPEDILL